MIGQGGITHAFIVEFESVAHRDYYAKTDPDHLAFGASLIPIVDKVQVIDFQPEVFVKEQSQIQFQCSTFRAVACMNETILNSHFASLFRDPSVYSSHTGGLKRSSQRMYIFSRLANLWQLKLSEPVDKCPSLNGDTACTFDSLCQSNLPTKLIDHYCSIDLECLVCTFEILTIPRKTVSP